MKKVTLFTVVAIALLFLISCSKPATAPDYAISYASQTDTFPMPYEASHQKDLRTPLAVPYKTQFPPTQKLPIDGVWLNERNPHLVCRIDSGRMYVTNDTGQYRSGMVYAHNINQISPIRYSCSVISLYSIPPNIGWNFAGYISGYINVLSYDRIELQYIPNPNLEEREQRVRELFLKKSLDNEALFLSQLISKATVTTKPRPTPKPKTVISKPAPIPRQKVVTPAPITKEKLAVVDLKAKHGVPKSLAQGLSVVIRDTIHSFGEYEVLSKEDVEVIAERTAIRQSLGCDDTQCLINIGRSLGTKYMVAGAISKFGDTYNVSLRLIYTLGKEPGVKKRINENCKCAEDELIDTAVTVSSLLMGSQKESVQRPYLPQKKKVVTMEPALAAEKIALTKTITNSIGMEFVLIPAGTFMMGTPPSDSIAHEDETQHEVTISNSFYLQTTEVTQGQWKRVMVNNPSLLSELGDKYPVRTVSWRDVKTFLRRLNQMEGTNKYRLPTEAEWEYACRAGTATRFHTGDCISTNQANHDGWTHQIWACPKAKGDSKPTYLKPVRVGNFQPNAWGLYDMHGNLWEWCQDFYGDYPSGQVFDPKGPPSGKYRVFRGGSYLSYVAIVRSAFRARNDPDFRKEDLGFRVAKDP